MSKFPLAEWQDEVKSIPDFPHFKKSTILRTVNTSQQHLRIITKINGIKIVLPCICIKIYSISTGGNMATYQIYLPTIFNSERLRLGNISQEDFDNCCITNEEVAKKIYQTVLEFRQEHQPLIDKKLLQYVIRMSDMLALYLGDAIKRDS